jgi:hypothetical protein
VITAGIRLIFCFKATWDSDCHEKAIGFFGPRVDPAICSLWVMAATFQGVGSYV